MMKKQKFNAADFFGKFGIVIILILLCALFAALNPAFISLNNIINILRQVAINGIIAVGILLASTVVRMYVTRRSQNKK